MERLTREGRDSCDGCCPDRLLRNLAPAAIGWVSDQPMARMGHMHPDLMGAPGFQPTFHQGGHGRGAKTFQGARTGHGMAAHTFIENGLPLAVGLVARQIGGDAQNIAGLKAGTPRSRASAGRRHQAHH